MSNVDSDEVRTIVAGYKIKPLKVYLSHRPCATSQLLTQPKIACIDSHSIAPKVSNHGGEKDFCIARGLDTYQTCIVDSCKRYERQLLWNNRLNSIQAA